MLTQRQSAKILLVMLLATAVCAPVSMAQADARMRIEPARLQIDPGEPFELQVIIEDLENVGGFQFELTYDPAVLDVEEVTLSDFLESTGRSMIPVSSEVRSEEGLVIAAAVTFGDQPGPEGSGVLAVISGTARADGSAALSLQNVQLLDTAADEKSVELEGGEIIVGEGGAPAPAPTPTTEPSEATAAPTSESSEEAVASTPTASSAASPSAPSSSGIPSWAFVVGGAVLAVAAVAVLILGGSRR